MAFANPTYPIIAAVGLHDLLRKLTSQKIETSYQIEKGVFNFVFEKFDKVLYCFTWDYIQSVWKLILSFLAERDICWNPCF